MCAHTEWELRKESEGQILASPAGGWGVGHTTSGRFTRSRAVHSSHTSASPVSSGSVSAASPRSLIRREVLKHGFDVVAKLGMRLHRAR